MYTDKNGKTWYKGNLHTHTTLSDGTADIEDAIALYASNGYDFISVTDHWRWHESEKRDDILIISGGEFNLGGNYGTDVYHILGIGCRCAPEVKKSNTPQETINIIKNAGGVAILAHPAWSLNSPEDLLRLEGVDMSEIFNSVSDVPFNCRPYSGVILDIMAARGTAWLFGAADDTHFYKKSDSCRSYIYVDAKSNSESDILNAIREGKFYSSQGPRISVGQNGNKLTVDTTPAEEIVFFTNQVYAPDRSVVGSDVVYGEYEIKPDDTYVRVEVKDKHGNYAWSQYYLF